MKITEKYVYKLEFINIFFFETCIFGKNFKYCATV
jgi:hypothetical protein